MYQLAHRILRFVSSTSFFIATLVLFAAQSSWLAITSRFPMAFDEAYHFGLIQFFAHRLSPIISAQPETMNKFGALPQNPSLLYHYILSWPDRLINIFTDAPVIHVICLRLCNVGLVIASLFLMRKLLRLLPLSTGLSNLLIFAFAFTPIVPVLAAQINYFNLLVLTATGCVYLLIRFMNELRARRFDSRLFLLLVSLSLLSSLVAFAFLPILAVIGCALVFVIVRSRRQSRVVGVRRGFDKLPALTKILLLTLVVASGVLWLRVYGVNLLRYHTPVPQCNQVLSVEACQHYYSWGRNHDLYQQTVTHPPAFHMSFALFSMRWFVVNTFYLFGVVQPRVGLSYVSTPYFVILSLLGIVLTTTLVVTSRVLLKNRDVQLLCFIIIAYSLAVWGRNYHDYLHLGVSVAVNGRYVVPIVIFGFAILGLGLQLFLHGRGKHAILLKAALTSFTIVLCLVFGGFNQYLAQITPSYGHLNSSNNFVLPDYQSIK